MSMMKRLALAALLACTAQSFAVAQPTIASSQADDIVVVQFRPPLDRPVHYEVSKSERPGVQRLTLRFERSDTGYLLHASTSFLGGRGDGLLGSALAQSATFVLDAQGKSIGIVDEETYWRRVTAAVETSKETAADRAFVIRFLNDIRTKPEAQRASVASNVYRAALRGIGTHRSMKAAESSLIPIRTEVTASADKVNIVVESDLGWTEMAKFIETIRKMGAPYEGPTQPEFSVTMREILVVDRATGLLDRSDYEARSVQLGKAMRSITTVRLMHKKS